MAAQYIAWVSPMNSNTKEDAVQCFLQLEKPAKLKVLYILQTPFWLRSLVLDLSMHCRGAASKGCFTICASLHPT